MRRVGCVLGIVLLAGGAFLFWWERTCCPDPGGDEEPIALAWAPADSLTEAEVEAGRYDDDWRDAIEFPVPRPRELGLDTIAIPETWGDIAGLASEPLPEETAAIGPSAAAPPDRPAVHLPLGGQVEGPSVFRVQALLDRARFSPGILDGRWGKNTEKAVFWLQRDEGLPPTGVVDSVTFERLWERAGRPASVIVDRVLDEADVEGPFAPIPADVYALAERSCSCYESLSEKLAERFHASAALLEELNPGVELDAVAAGDTLRVPDLDAPAPEVAIARLEISGAGYYIHAVDADGRILYHFPTTLGSTYDPSPEGDLEVVSVHRDPWFHYQPRLLAGVDPSLPNTTLPPGPNNLVGDTWIKLSEPHYGIHGTRSPETIGYAMSSGCVRLTNWDARFLRERVGPGTPVVFTATRSATPATDPSETAVPGG